MIDTTQQWMSANSGLLGWLIGLSILTVILSAIIVPVLVLRMQPDHFLATDSNEDSKQTHHPILRLMAKVGKNVVGIILVIGGILMCVLPGQGLLTILIGLAVMDLPGKRKFEVWLFRKKPINWTINKIREKANREPLLIPS